MSTRSRLSARASSARAIACGLGLAACLASPTFAIADAPSPSAAPAAGATPAAPPSAPTVSLATFALARAGRFASLAVGEKRVAAWGEDIALFDGAAWTSIPLPPKLRAKDGERDEVRIHFGRDDMPRLMGARLGPSGDAAIYLRYRGGAWKQDRKEIGSLLDAPTRGLFGVLGHADPEVVCKPGDRCIVKRRTGWKTIPAGPARERVELAGGSAWALREGAIARLDADATWTVVKVPGATGPIGGVWAAGDELWVSEPGAARLHHRKGGAWSTEPAPFASPRGLAGPSPDDVWVAGEAGLAHFDGARWSRVEGPRGPLAEVALRGREVWAAGESGVWRGDRR
jgi:hypothetical protein